jgi:type II secretory pathway pseudopilin PulG
MDLVPIFILVLLTIIAITLVLISIKLTDLLAESKASRTAVQNIESDELFRQSYQSQQARLSQAQHTEQILTLLQGMQHLLSSRLRGDKTVTPVPGSEKTVLYSSEQQPQHRFQNNSHG